MVDERLDWPQVVALETHQLDLPGVSLQVKPRRHYFYDSLAAHLLGYVGEVTVRISIACRTTGWATTSASSASSGVGRPPCAATAAGRKSKSIRSDAGCRLLREIPERPGNSVVMTIDLDLQRVAEDAIGDRAGALVAIDPNTGYILAMASHPTFDPNVFAGGIQSVGLA